MDTCNTYLIASEERKGYDFNGKYLCVLQTQTIVFGAHYEQTK